ncbi:hypothetical protein G6F31_019387 [Rhizopus arrhizus]|nr:hypothetical protein G6F31_019387 [Rhizopus arrhizus]
MWPFPAIMPCTGWTCNCAAAKRWRSSANPAAASPPPRSPCWACCRGMPACRAASCSKARTCWRCRNASAARCAATASP